MGLSNPFNFADPDNFANPSALALGQVIGQGSAPTAARSDHQHGWGDKHVLGVDGNGPLQIAGLPASVQAVRFEFAVEWFDPGTGQGASKLMLTLNDVNSGTAYAAEQLDGKAAAATAANETAQPRIPLTRETCPVGSYVSGEGIVIKRAAGERAQGVVHFSIDAAGTLTTGITSFDWSDVANALASIELRNASLTASFRFRAGSFLIAEQIRP